MLDLGPTPPVCGALFDADGQATFRVWAPFARWVQLVLLDEAGGLTPRPMVPQPGGYFTASVSGVCEGQRYGFKLSDGPLRPDPVSLSQPEGVHGPSAIVRLNDFAWTDHGWRGIPRPQLALYELHVGTFTPEGTFDAIIPRLAELVELGITAIELMPIAQFPGVRNWGYDGVCWYAVQHSYGGARGLQRLVNAAHAAGLAIILDVVYNHVGPEGNYLREFGPYFSAKHTTPWGDAVNFDDRDCAAVRAHVLNNVRMWIRDFHLDGLRLDATHAIVDDSPLHVLSEMAATARDAGGERIVHVIAENEWSSPKLVLPVEQGGFGLDAQWADDFHHCLHTLLTGEDRGYYQDFQQPAEQLPRALRESFVYAGEFKPSFGRPHGEPVGDLATDHFVICTQNHDQVGNRAAGERLSMLVEPAGLRLAAGLMLLSPYVPLLFMGEEYGEQRPFPFFCDFGDRGLQEAVRRGRRAEFAEFGWTDRVPDPQAITTFASAKLSWHWSDSTWQGGLRALYADLLRARRDWPELQSVSRSDFAVHSPRDNWPVLTVVRRNALEPVTRIAAMFNITSRSIPLPPGFDPHTALLRSEQYRYGGAAQPGETQLAPCEFIVFRTDQSIRFDPT